VEPAGGAKGPWQKVLHALQEPFKRIGARDTRSRGGKKTKNGARKRKTLAIKRTLR